MAAFTLITGASSGIGRQISLRLNNHRNLILSGRRSSALNLLSKEVQDQGGEARTWIIDLRSGPQVGVELQAFLKNTGLSIDTFIHCAGVVFPMATKSFDYESVWEMMEVNLLSAMTIVKVLLKRVNCGALKNIIFISALSSRRAVKGNSFYSSSKSALDGWMRSLALELAPAVRVNSVLPGGVRTPMTEHIYQNPEELARFISLYPLGPGLVDDVAGVVEFLLTENARWITGQQICVDGGASLV